jgi:hypothetical protein
MIANSLPEKAKTPSELLIKGFYVLKTFEPTNQFLDDLKRLANLFDD